MNSPRKVKFQKAASGKSNSRCLRLNNNALTEIDSLIEVASTLFEKPSDIAWLDLSFNELTTINPVSIMTVSFMQQLIGTNDHFL